jgi:hypothetical protein
MTKFVGYHENKDLPIKAGDTVTILKGTKIKSMHPTRKVFTAGRTYQVKVNHVLCGSSDFDLNATLAHLSTTNERKDIYIPRSNPSVRWPGYRGYWSEVDINDIPEAIIDPTKVAL